MPHTFERFGEIVMTLSRAQILLNLDPHNPESIQSLIDFHRATFGGWSMEDPPDGAKPEGEGGNPDAGKPDDGKPEGDKPLGPNGEKALQTERDARKALEQQFASLKSGIAAALGIEGKDAKSSTDDMLAQLQTQLSSLQRSNLVLEVAGENSITEKDDLALLRDFTGDEAGLRRLAARLKPSGGEKQQENNGQRRAPKPDLSQGRGGSAPTGREAGLAEARKRFPSTTK